MLTEPRNALIKQYQHLFKMEEAELTFTHDALSVVAKKAQERKTGARALRSIIETFMVDVMFDLPDLRKPLSLVVDADLIEQGWSAYRAKHPELVTVVHPAKPAEAGLSKKTEERESA